MKIKDWICKLGIHFPMKPLSSFWDYVGCMTVYHYECGHCHKKWEAEGKWNVFKVYDEEKTK